MFRASFQMLMVLMSLQNNFMYFCLLFQRFTCFQNHSFKVRVKVLKKQQVKLMIHLLPSLAEFWEAGKKNSGLAQPNQWGG